MKLASITPIFVLAFFLLGGFTSASMAQESRWGSPDEETVKFIIAVEAKWASSACSPQPDLKAVIADDFEGTSPTGRRYGKDEAITTDTKSLARDCQLGEVRVKFFGDSIAIAYGAESWIDKANDGKETKRCQIWTDTWLKRQGSGRSWPRRTPSSLVSLRLSREAWMSPFARSAAQAIRPSAAA
jgi:Domain of unknown function (DUF4440)